MAHGACSVVKEFPSVGTIQPAYADRRYELGMEVSEVYTVLAARRRLQWFPVSDASTRPAVDSAQRFVALDVLFSCLRMPLDFDGTKLEVDPWPTNASAQGTVAGGGYFRRGRQFQPNCATVAGTFVHFVFSVGTGNE